MTKFWIVAILFAAACSSSGSGVDGTKTLVSLSSSDQNSLCTYIVSMQGSPRTVDCGGGVTLTVGNQTVAGCVASVMMNIAAHPDCTATVSDAENCFADIEALSDTQLCTETTGPASCAVVDGPTCSGSGS